jgi:hypothetical protein
VDTDVSLASVLREASFWQRINQSPINERQHLVVDRLLDDFVGLLTTTKYA